MSSEKVQKNPENAQQIAGKSPEKPSIFREQEWTTVRGFPTQLKARLFLETLTRYFPENSLVDCLILHNVWREYVVVLFPTAEQLSACIDAGHATDWKFVVFRR